MKSGHKYLDRQSPTEIHYKNKSLSEQDRESLCRYWEMHVEARAARDFKEAFDSLDMFRKQKEFVEGTRYDDHPECYQIAQDLILWLCCMDDGPRVGYDEVADISGYSRSLISKISTGRWLGVSPDAARDVVDKLEPVMKDYGYDD